jgi:hypothetical protein
MKAQADIPEFCGFSCPHADFPPADSAGICRTMAAVHCNKLGMLVDKNAPCRWRRQSKRRNLPAALKLCNKKGHGGSMNTIVPGIGTPATVNLVKENHHDRVAF